MNGNYGMMDASAIFSNLTKFRYVEFLQVIFRLTSDSGNPAFEKPSAMGKKKVPGSPLLFVVCWAQSNLQFSLAIF